MGAVVVGFTVADPATAENVTRSRFWPSPENRNRSTAVPDGSGSVVDAVVHAPGPPVVGTETVAASFPFTETAIECEEEPQDETRKSARYRPTEETATVYCSHSPSRTNARFVVPPWTSMSTSSWRYAPPLFPGVVSRYETPAPPGS